MSMQFYTRRSVPACCYIRLAIDQQAALYQKNWASMLLYNTGSWSAGDIIQEKWASMMLYYTESWSAGDFVPEEPG